MTPGPNVAWILEAFERWNAGDRTPPIERVDPGVEIHTLFGDAFQGEPYRGHEGVRAWFTVVALGNVHFRGRGSGVESDQPVAWVVQFRGEKLVRLQTYYDHQEALAAGGIS